MKNKLLIFSSLLILSCTSLAAQNDTLWTRHINALPDSTPLTPVKLRHDNNNGVLALSNYYKSTNPGVENKTHLRKFDADGDILWTIILNAGNTRAYDMVIDDNGFAYIAGIINQRPMLFKTSPEGDLVWLKDSFTAFKTGSLQQILWYDGRIYAGGEGVACLDTGGNELWSKQIYTTCMAVDTRGQLVVSSADTGNMYLSRFDRNGQRNFADSFYMAKRLVTDIYNNIYALTDLPGYQLVKYDSTGKKKWSRSGFPTHVTFGDIGMELLVDHDNNLWVIGLQDTIYKYNPSGKLLWRKSMHGLDNYILVAVLTGDNSVMIAGSTYKGSEYDLKVAQFNQQGRINWAGNYSGNTGKQEFAVDVTVGNSGVYALENNEQNGTLVKFGLPGNGPVHYSQICVDSVWYDPQDTSWVYVRIFNGSADFVNYPGVDIVSPGGDTISKHITMFFGQAGNSYLSYRSRIKTSGITDFTPYIFLFRKGMDDTTVRLQWCSTLGVKHLSKNLRIQIYPNPFHKSFIVNTPENIAAGAVISIYDATGRLIMKEELEPVHYIRMDHAAPGVYFYTIHWAGQIIQTGKLVAE